MERAEFSKLLDRIDNAASRHVPNFDLVDSLKSEALQAFDALQAENKALRDALFATKKLHGMTGDINCDQYGDCGTQVYAVWEFTSGASGSFAAGTNPKKIFP